MRKDEVYNISINTYRVLQDYINRFLLENRTIVIYGAGKRGKTIAEILLKNGVEEFIFCDRKKESIGALIHGKQCVSPEQIYKNSQNYFVLITPSNSQVIEDELLKNGFQLSRDYVNYSKDLISWFMEYFNRKQETGVLLLGDCYWISCDSNSEKKNCLYDELEFLIKSETEINRLAMNALTISEYYWIFRAYVSKGNRPDLVMVSIDVRNFNIINYMLPGNQHVDLLKEIYENIPVDGLEDYIKEKIEKSEKTIGFNTVVDNSEKQWTKERNQIKLNYCYRWKAENEEIEYLIKLIHEIHKINAIPVVIFLPVNFETAKEKFKIDFMGQYEKNKQKIVEQLQKYTVNIMDLSYRVGKYGFSGKQYFNEILNEKNKEIIAKEVYKKYKRLRKK